jgi:NAD(P)-dependent dehydrogenase (short-subunit alcohol dehydrogenase family)
VLPLDFGLDGKMAIVTGSGSGIGRILALGLAQAGAHIVVADLAEKREVAEETARAVRGTGRRALVSALDVLPRWKASRPWWKKLAAPSIGSTSW